MYKQKLDEVMSHEISRQDFLKASGALILTLMGLPALMSSVGKLFAPQKQKTLSKSSSNGYGGRAYGR